MAVFGRKKPANADLQAVGDALVVVFEATAVEGVRIRVEDLLSGGATANGEACVAAGGRVRSG